MDQLYLLDTNIFMRFLIKENQVMFAESAKLIESISLGKLKAYIPTIVLAEIASNLKSPYRFSHQTIAKIIAGIIRTKNLAIIDDIDHQKASKLFLEANIKFTDCLIASSKKVQTGLATLISYDKDFDKVKGIKRLEPKDLL